ncbi:MAG TPA: rhomboid family intramembrane serine protease [Acidimicrobiales bacterium]|nr:rhomboid family intramembrane serine protease [Acidimicrobiales bacterium]
MIPLKDENPTRGRPLVTLVLIAACVAVYFLIQPGGQQLLGRTAANQGADLEFTLRNAAIPCEVVHDRPLSETEVVDTFRNGQQTACESRPATPPVFPHKNVYLAILVSMFLHGSVLHIGGNMLYLWIFGNNIEDAFGKVGYVVFYLVGGFVATLAHILVQPSSTVPVVGASGAIAAVMGAYLVLFPRVRIRTLFLLFFVIFFRSVEARWLLIFWLALQFFTNPNEGVAWVAHVGGFLFGAAVAAVYRAVKGPGGAAPVVAYDPYRY